MSNATRKGWIPYKLDELGFVGRGKSRHRPRNAPELYAGSYPFIQTAEVTASEFYITEYSQTYSELGLAQSKMWNKNTLCIVIAGENTAETAILNFRACFPDSIIGFVADSERTDVRFIKYYLRTIKKQLRSVTKGATQDNLSVEKLLSFDILTPPLLVQKKIVEILSAYDELIENNTRRIKVLEEMAQMLYREWFVHFRFPGYEQVKMVDSELGLIPEAWGVGRLDDALILQRGFDLPTKQRQEGSVPIYASTGATGTHNAAKVKGPGVVTGRSGSLGTVIYIDEDFWPLNTTLWVKEFRKVTPLYAFYLLSNLGLEQFNSGAAVPTLNRNNIHGLQVVLPPYLLLKQFNSFVEPLFSLKKNLQARNINLRYTRDLLLPKLIAGEIDVESLDINTGDVAA